MCGELNLVNRKVKPKRRVLRSKDQLVRTSSWWKDQKDEQQKNSFGDLLCDLLVVIHFTDTITQRHVEAKQQPGEYFASELCHTEPGCTASFG